MLINTICVYWGDIAFTLANVVNIVKTNKQHLGSLSAKYNVIEFDSCDGSPLYIYMSEILS